MKLTHYALLAVCAIGLGSVTASAQRTERTLRSWRFSHTDTPEQAAPGFNDRRWQQVSVPHDWAIAGPFNKDIDKQVVAIEQNGEKEATEKTGRSGSLPWIGTGWYRTEFSVSTDPKRVILNFDGAMAEPEVFVNGRKAGEWKYGYNTFNIDVTDFVHHDGKPNTLAVRLQNLEESSRWYPGAGLYRPVTLIETTSEAAFEQWGLTAVTDRIHADGSVDATFYARTTDAAAEDCDVEFSVVDGKTGKSLCTSIVPAKERNEVVFTTRLNGVRLWTPETPELYTLRARLVCRKEGEKVLDQQERRIGFRKLEVSASEDFTLNGQSRKFRGVCLHHDLGMLGSAVNKSALARQINLLKSMGCDAIRTAHNMPSQMQMDLCDSLGMMVMAESFDMWIYAKCKNGYNRFFKEWADRDIENLVLANRHHPSIVMWSIGNEIPEQGMKDGARIVRHLQDVVHGLDPDRGRYVTTGMDRIDNALNTGFAQVIDIPGMNYRTQKYDMAYERLGQGFVLGSETASTISSRGVYKFPVKRNDSKAYDDGQCSGYDVEACSWSNIPEDDWVLQDDRKWTIGEFVWTGFDYLGEPSPYDEYWPSRSSYFGIFDLAGLPKDRYYLYRSRWNTTDETIHVLPHWNWTGREGEVTPVYCYTNYPTAELFVNGKSQGKRTKVADAQGATRTTSIDDPKLDRYRLRWNDVRYEPGEIRVVVYDAEGNERGSKTVRTTGAPAAIALSGDLGAPLPEMRVAEDEMVFVTVNVVDSEGNICPNADNQLSVSVSGEAKFRGICNGDATSLEVFTNPTMKAFHGQLVVGLQSTGKPGDIRLTVRGNGLKAATAVIKAK